MELNRKQIIKALECCNTAQDALCDQCPYNNIELADDEKCSERMALDAITLIKELTEENERLRAEKEVLEITEKDLRFRNKELQRCNEGLAKNIEELEIEGDMVREAYAHYEETTGLKQVRADTVRKMQERLKTKSKVRMNTLFGKCLVLTDEDIDQIAKEMLEGEK